MSPRKLPPSRERSTEDSGRAARALPRVNRWIVAALVAATAAAYAPALKAPFLLDDAVTVEAASHWDATPGMPSAGRPLVLATLALNHETNRRLGVDERPYPDGPDQTVGYRAFNILVHLLTGALLFAFLRRAAREEAIEASWRAIADPLAGVVTALWLLHPIQSEVINYVVQRSEGMASLFYVAVLYASQRAWDSRANRRAAWYALAVAAAALGMLSKEIVITAPLAVMLYDRAFRLRSWRELFHPPNRRGWLYLLLWLAVVATFAAFGSGARGDSAGLGMGVTWYGYLYTQCWAIAHYLRLVVWPDALSPDYGFRPIHGWRGVPGLILLAAFGAATLAAWRRAERWGWFAFTGSMFFILLAPSSSVVPVVLEIAAERRIYLALAAVLVLAAVGAEWVRRRAAARLSPRGALAAAAVIAAALGVATGARSRTYADPVALWRRAIAAVPGDSRAWSQLGYALFMRDTTRYAEAESSFVKALAIDSSCQSGCLQYGALLTREGRYKEAIPLLERNVTETETARFDLMTAKLIALGWMKLGGFGRALPYLEQVAQVDPTMSHFVALGVSYLSVGRRDEAVATFRLMATFDPGSGQLQQLCRRLEDGANHPEALANLQEFALSMTRGWM